MPRVGGSLNDSGVWLTFTNSTSLSEPRIRELFEPYGGIQECDGAVNGPCDGWVMVSMESLEKANKAIKSLQDLGNSIGHTLKLMNSGAMENGSGGSVSICLRCGRNDHHESDCRSRDKTCKRCERVDPDSAIGHFGSIHNVNDSKIRSQVIDLLGPKSFSDWPEAKLAENVKIVTKRAAHTNDHDKFDNPNTFGGSNDLLSSSDISEVGGIKNFSSMNAKILELVSHNNNLLMERLRDTVDDCNRQLKEKDDQIRRLQNLLSNHEENMRKMTNKLNSTLDMEAKVKKFFGENEDFHKKKIAELTKRLEEREKERLDKVLEESDSSKVRVEVEKLTGITDSILSKTEQVLATVQGMDLGTVVRTEGKGEVKVDSMSGNTTLLHNKVDKSIRLLSETSENQKKMNKVLQDLIKYTGLMNQDKDAPEPEEKKKKKKDKERDRSRGRKRSRSRSGERRRRSRSGSADRMKVPAVMPPSSIDHEYEEIRWGLNMALIGDDHWSSFMDVDDIKNIVERMNKKVNFKVMCNDNETLASMYEEERQNLMVALPKACHKVGISIGSKELNDPSLLTLNDAPMDEVRRRNEPKLTQKARILKELVLTLIRQNKQVIVMIPPHGETRLEVHTQWEEILLSKLRDIRFPSIKILNMAQIMKSTRSEFNSNNEYLDMWLKSYPKPRRHLSPYGTRRMFYALRQTVISKTPQQAGMDNWPTPQTHPPPTSLAPQLPTPTPAQPPVTHQSRMAANAAAIAQPRPEDFNCPRCTRPGHPPEHCNSKDRVCRKCGIVGHFSEVHDVDDERFRQVISKVLGIDLWDKKRFGGGYDDYHGGGRMEEPDYKRNRRGHSHDQDMGGGYYGGGGGRGDYY